MSWKTGGIGGLTGDKRLAKRLKPAGGEVSDSEKYDGCSGVGMDDCSLAVESGELSVCSVHTATEWLRHVCVVSVSGV